MDLPLSTLMLTIKPYSSSSHLLAIFIATLFINAAASTTKIPSKASLKFIKNSCNTTTYPPLCYKTLSPYAASIKTSSSKLCYTSLTLSIKAARDTSTVISRLSKQKGISKIEAAVIRDCKENIATAIDELKQSRDTMSSLQGTPADKAFQLDNAKTWASAAITDETTCLDGFSGRKVNASVVKNRIRSTIKTVSQLTSISLSLITHLNY